MRDAFYLNSLKAWRAQLQSRQRQTMGRLKILEKVGAPEAVAHRRLGDLNKYLIEIVSDKIEIAEAE